MRIAAGALSLVFLLSYGVPLSWGLEITPLLATLRAVGPKGAGHRDAARAWQELARARADQLPQVLAGMDGAGPLAANWIATAAESIAERQLQRGGKLPAAELEKFTLDRRHAPRARRLAFEWLTRADPTAPKRLLPGMLNDPSLELRRDAVARLIEEGSRLADGGKKEESIAVLRRALTAARDIDQIRLLAGRLRKAGEKIDLARHFGFLLRWKLIGPFDNTGEKGFDAVYPPERRIDFTASYAGKHGPVKWIDYTSTDDYGKIDLNKALGEEKSVAGYAAAEFISGSEQQVELRASSFNALKVWLNGTLVYDHNVYHSGAQLDQYVCRGTLRPGRNLILVKICQNAQTQDWARYWYFQLRVCDEQGTAILSADRSTATVTAPQPTRR
jgi:hypothetical protein